MSLDAKDMLFCCVMTFLVGLAFGFLLTGYRVAVEYGEMRDAFTTLMLDYDASQRALKACEAK